ncbi:MAG: hypothetical protein JJE25_12275, partial [Bacteroidia bacterium]|nr:hypothetical protein [Bacteroidia bacterium]
MYTPDISSLQSEIAQLKKIISALLEQIEMLKANNTGAGQGIGQKDFIDLHTQQHIGQKDFTGLHTQQHMGQNESINLHTQQRMGQNESINLHTQQR